MACAIKRPPQKGIAVARKGDGVRPSRDPMAPIVLGKAGEELADS